MSETTIDFTPRPKGPRTRFSAEELRARRNERNRIYYYRYRDIINEKSRMKRLKANQENINTSYKIVTEEG